MTKQIAFDGVQKVDCLSQLIISGFSSKVPVVLIDHLSQRSHFATMYVLPRGAYLRHVNPVLSISQSRPDLTQRVTELIRLYDRGVNRATIRDVDVHEVAERFRDHHQIFKFRMGNVFAMREAHVDFLQRIVMMTVQLAGGVSPRDLIMVRLLFPDRNPISRVYEPYAWYLNLDNCARWWEEVVDAAEESEGEYYVPIVISEDCWFHVQIFRQP